MSNKAWTNEELDKLIKLYPYMRMDYLLTQLPGRSRYSIYCKARYLGLRSNPERMNIIRFVSENPSLSARKIAGIIGANISTVDYYKRKFLQNETC